MKIKSLVCIYLLALLAAYSDDGNTFPKVVSCPVEDRVVEPTFIGVEQPTVIMSFGELNKAANAKKLS